MQTLVPAATCRHTRIRVRDPVRLQRERAMKERSEVERLDNPRNSARFTHISHVAHRTVTTPAVRMPIHARINAYIKSHSRNASVLLGLAAVLLLPSPALAQADKTSEIDKIFSWATPATPGCAVAVSQHGKLVVNRAYGSADLERDVADQPEHDLRCRIA